MPLGGGTKDLSGRLALAKLSDDLVANEEARKSFIADPDAHIAREYGIAPSGDDAEFVGRLRDMVADGFCCHGCGCSGLEFGERVINPAVLRRG
jgi:hypothetical protein